MLKSWRRLSILYLRSLRLLPNRNRSHRCLWPAKACPNLRRRIIPIRMAIRPPYYLLWPSRPIPHPAPLLPSSSWIIVLVLTTTIKTSLRYVRNSASLHLCSLINAHLQVESTPLKGKAPTGIFISPILKNPHVRPTFDDMSTSRLIYESPPPKSSTSKPARLDAREVRKVIRLVPAVPPSLPVQAAKEKKQTTLMDFIRETNKLDEEIDETKKKNVEISSSPPSTFTAVKLYSCGSGREMDLIRFSFD